ncbi:hypothetical protein MGH68_16225 [Erysipelothrix sp. D19-032]
MFYQRLAITVLGIEAGFGTMLVSSVVAIVASYINTNYIIPGVPFTDVRENLQPLNDFGLMLGIYGLITAAVESISKGTKWLNGEGTGNSNYTGNRNIDNDFGSGESLSDHASRHGKDFGYTTDQQYLEGARKFLDNPSSGVESFTASDGRFFQFNPKNW